MKLISGNNERSSTFGRALSLCPGSIPPLLHRAMTTVHVKPCLEDGRHNPVWNLSEGEASMFLELLAALPADHSVINGPMVTDGHRGLRVVVQAWGSTQKLTIGGGVVCFAPAHPADHQRRRDPGRALEKWLLETGQTHLGGTPFQELLPGVSDFSNLEPVHGPTESSLAGE